MRNLMNKLINRLPEPLFSLKLRLKILISLMLLLVVGGPLFFLVRHIDHTHHEFSTNMIETTTSRSLRP